MVRYSDELIEEIRNRNDIVDVVSQYVTLKRSGKNYMGLCPFHKEKSPSFCVSPDRQIFHCFGCGVGGDSIRFISKIENLDFIQTIEMLAEKSGVQLPTEENGQDDEKIRLKEKVYEINKIASQFYHENLYKPTSKVAQEYVKKRKLDNNTLKTFSIGFSTNFDELYQILKSKGFTQEEILASSLVKKSEKGTMYDSFRDRLMFPIKDIKDRVIAFGGRVLDDSKPKYINSPENIVYSKGRNLFGMNIAKNSRKDKIIIVEGYMDAISLYQRGINNVVASLGTALTQNQGRLLRKYASQILIGYDADGAGQNATVRGMEILQNMGCDIRILQLDGEAKDPDEYIIKYGSARFQKRVDEAISLVEYKVKNLKNTLSLNSASDKIKFLNEVVKILSKVDNDIEKEIYIDKISKEYEISKDVMYSELNKKSFNNTNSLKQLVKPVVVMNTKKSEKSEISEGLVKRENLIISLLINQKQEIYQKIKSIVSPEDFKYEKNKEIIQKLYEQLEKGDSNNNLIELFDDEELINHITYIMAYDFEITDENKAIEDIVSIYKKEKLTDKKNEILKKIEQSTDRQEQTDLERQLNNIIIELAKNK